MPYVRCYECGARCNDNEFVRYDLETHAGMRRVNLCRRCLKEIRHEEKIKKQESQNGGLVCLIVLACVVGVLFGMCFLFIMCAGITGHH